VTPALRPRALAALLAVLAMTGVSAGCGSDARDVSRAESSGEARALLENAFARQKAVDGGDVALELKADVQGIGGLEGPLELRLEGPFKSNGKRKLPSLDWDVGFSGAGQRLSGGVIVTENDAFLRFQGRSYELGKNAFARIARRLELTHPDRWLGPGQIGWDPVSWLENPNVGDGDPIGGEDTRKITGSVDVHKAVGDVVDLLESPAVRKKLERDGRGARELGDKDLKEIEDAVKEMEVELNVDRHGVLRRLFTRIAFDLSRDGDDLRGKLSFTYVLRKVGTNPVIRAPSGARPLSELLGGFGFGGLGLGLDGKHD